MDITTTPRIMKLDGSYASAFVMRHIPYMVLAGFVLLAMLYTPFYEFVSDHYITNLWGLLVVSILLASMALFLVNKRQSQTSQAMHQYLLKMLHLNAIAFAFIWTLMLLLIYPNSSREYQLLILLLVAAICAGAFPVLVVFRYVYLIFISILLWPFILAQLFHTNTLPLAVFLSLYWGLLVLAANNMGASIRALLYLKAANLDLVDRLADANVDLEQLNKALLEENAFRIRSSEMMREKSQFLERIMDATSDAIMVLDHQGMVIRINREVVELGGYQQEVLLGRHYTDNLFPNSDPNLMTMVHDAMTQGKVHPRTESWMLTCTGELKELQVSVSVLSGPAGINAVVCTMVDNTREKEVARLKDELVANVSNELRTPLTSIYGSLRLLESKLLHELSSPMQNMLTIATQNSHRLLMLVNDLLDVHRLEATPQEYKFTNENIAELVTEALNATQGYANNHRITLVLRQGLGLQVRVDKRRFIQVLFNVLSNAIKFTPSGKSVFVDMSRQGDYLRLQITDQGEGIAETFQPYLFERYRQGKNATPHQQQGGGLGLHIAKQLIESMGGRIAYKTIKGQGTSFYIDILRTESGTGTE